MIELALHVGLFGACGVLVAVTDDLAIWAMEQAAEARRLAARLRTLRVELERGTS